jgi:hypothetical protein
MKRRKTVNNYQSYPRLWDEIEKVKEKSDQRKENTKVLHFAKKKKIIARLRTFSLKKCMGDLRYQYTFYLLEYVIRNCQKYIHLMYFIPFV